MTNEEAKMWVSKADSELENLYGVPYSDIQEKIFKSLDIAIQALEKQIPKKPYITERGCVDTYCCQNCKESLYEVDTFEESFALRKMIYCDNCGQALDWSDTE